MLYITAKCANSPISEKKNRYCGRNFISSRNCSVRILGCVIIIFYAALAVLTILLFLCLVNKVRHFKFYFPEGSIGLDRRFIGALLATGFLCAFPPALDKTSARPINFANFYAYFHRYSISHKYLFI